MLFLITGCSAAAQRIKLTTVEEHTPFGVLDVDCALRLAERFFPNGRDFGNAAPTDPLRQAVSRDIAVECGR